MTDTINNVNSVSPNASIYIVVYNYTSTSICVR